MSENYNSSNLRSKSFKEPKDFATYSHPVHGMVQIRLFGRRPDLWHGKGGWRLVGR